MNTIQKKSAKAYNEELQPERIYSHLRVQTAREKRDFPWRTKMLRKKSADGAHAGVYLQRL